MTSVKPVLRDVHVVLLLQLLLKIRLPAQIRSARLISTVNYSTVQTWRICVCPSLHRDSRDEGFQRESVIADGYHSHDDSSCPYSPFHVPLYRFTFPSQLIAPPSKIYSTTCSSPHGKTPTITTSFCFLFRRGGRQGGWSRK